ncbi:tetratricopeptide repeat protein [Pseudarthrobacter sp. J1763]|uniref:tetratricopeptide repeat protein n=1 Tax=Pseudarthrobacter sp. J1763 TaxID=3420445 RepID=UPI003D2BE19D
MDSESLKLSTSEWPESGFPGIKVNPLTRRVEVVDEDMCDRALAASDRPADKVFVLMTRGKISEAAEILAEARFHEPESFDLLLLDAELLYVSGRFERSVERLKFLLAEYQGQEQEAYIRQHLGNTYFGLGDYARAVDCFEKALDLRVAVSADAALIYSSTIALHQARISLDEAS